LDQQWINSLPSGSSENIIIDKEEKFIYSGLRDFGFVILKFEDLSLASYFNTKSTEDLALSDDNKFLYVTAS